MVDHYPLCDLDLDLIQRIFPSDFVGQLQSILICGHYGDFVTVRGGTDCVEYFYQDNPDLQVSFSTNTSAQTQIWSRLGPNPEMLHTV